MNTDIPKGKYCYTTPENLDGSISVSEKVCPYWSCDEDLPKMMSGYCTYLERGAIDIRGFSLFWDKVKERGENIE